MRAPYPQDTPDLTIVNHHEPTTVADLKPDELEQLTAAFAFDGEEIDSALGEHDVEAAEVVDSTGIVRYRLYGWGFGVIYLFPAQGIEVVALCTQHEVEHWHLDQRPLFAGMDRALNKPGHGFVRQQPLFCWDDDECWDEIGNPVPGTIPSRW